MAVVEFIVTMLFAYGVVPDATTQNKELQIPNRILEGRMLLSLV